MVLHVFTSFLGGGPIVYPLWIVQWDFTRWDHLENPGRVSGLGLVSNMVMDFTFKLLMRNNTHQEPLNLLMLLLLDHQIPF